MYQPSRVESVGIIWVASEPASQPPPTLTGLVALRRLTVEARPTAIATAAGMPIDQDEALRPDLAGIACVLLVQPIPGDRTVLHVLVASNASPAAAGRCVPRPGRSPP